jgi:MarR family transcriptional regulator for hemolysin
MTQPLKTTSTKHDTHLTVAFHEIALMVARLFNGEVRHIGLTRSQWQVLHQLYSLDGQTQTDLAEALYMEKPPLGKLIDRLEHDGWVTRKEDAKDRRAKRVFLTKKVYPLIEPLEGIVEQIGETAMKGFSTSDRKAFESLLRRTHENLTKSLDNRKD